MKKTIVFLTLFVLGAVAISLVTRSAKASTIGVGSFDAVTGSPRDAFAIGEDIRIRAGSTDKPITIAIIFNPTLEVVHSEIVDSFNYDKILSGITTKGGWYTAVATSPVDSVRKNFAAVFFNVIPEAPLGTASLAIASLGAFGVYGLVRRRKTTYI